MAKKGKVEHNNKRIALTALHREKRNTLRKTANSPHVSDEERDEARRKLAKLPLNSNPIRIRNRCPLTGRPRGFLRKFGLCRMKVRELANQGLLPGVTKSSW